MVNECYYTYMTLVLFYLVYCFSYNKHQGVTAYNESLVESAQTVDDGVQRKQQLKKRYWKWLIKANMYEVGEFGTLDQAVLQEYIDIDGVLEEGSDMEEGSGNMR